MWFLHASSAFFQLCSSFRSSLHLSSHYAFYWCVLDNFLAIMSSFQWSLIMFSILAILSLVSSTIVTSPPCPNTRVSLQVSISSAVHFFGVFQINSSYRYYSPLLVIILTYFSFLVQIMNWGKKKKKSTYSHGFPKEINLPRDFTRSINWPHNNPKELS